MCIFGLRSPTVIPHCYFWQNVEGFLATLWLCSPNAPPCIRPRQKQLRITRFTTVHFNLSWIPQTINLFDVLHWLISSWKIQKTVHWLRNGLIRLTIYSQLKTTEKKFDEKLWLAVFSAGSRKGVPPPPPPPTSASLILGEKRRNHRRKKSRRASKTKPTPLPQLSARSGSSTVITLHHHARLQGKKRSLTRYSGSYSCCKAVKSKPHLLSCHSCYRAGILTSH